LLLVLLLLFLLLFLCRRRHCCRRGCLRARRGRRAFFGRVGRGVLTYPRPCCRCCCGCGCGWWLARRRRCGRFGL
jgi:hypothetical protein